MKKNLLKTLLVAGAMAVSQSTFANTAYYYYNKYTQFEVVPSDAAQVYATTKAETTHTENVTSDVFEGEPVQFFYNITAGYDDLYFTEETCAEGYHFAGFKVINKAQNEDGSDNKPTEEEIAAADLVLQVPVLKDDYSESGETAIPEHLSVSKLNIAKPTTDTTPDKTDGTHDGVLNGLYVGTTYTADGGTVGWHDYPDAYVYIYYSTEPVEDGISSVKADGGFKYVYDLNGARTSSLNKGINIVKMNDGSTRKVLK
jgi:hypothetical protein